MSDLRDRVQNTLDEGRMLILGGQVLVGIAAEAVLQPGFGALSDAGRWACAAAMVALVAAVGLLMWPAAYHRIVLEGQDRRRLLEFSGRVMTAALLPFAAALGACVLIAAERVAGPVAGVRIGIAATGVALAAWYAYPAAARLRDAPEQGAAVDESSTPIDVKVHQVLTEARMVLPGAQALLGFGVISTLTTAFDGLPPTLRAVHAAGLSFIAVAVVLLMTPAAYHRIAERGENSERFHRVATRLLLAAMALLAPGMGAALWMVLERATGSRIAGASGGVVTVVLYYAMWFGWTLSVKRTGRA
ncbi:MAG: hypothetical protein IT437_13450 [Phycisphaerales bacterium]|nr:hypothetical protein [Phycisphaerales bacterium]